MEIPIVMNKRDMQKMKKKLMHKNIAFLGSLASYGHASTVLVDTVPAEAASYASMYCASANRDYVYSSMDGDLLSYQTGSINLVSELALNENCGGISECVSTYQSDIVSTSLRAGVAILLCVITLIIFLIVSPCACSRRCRKSGIWCNMRERKVAHDVSPGLMRFGWIMFIVFLLGMIADVIAASVYASRFSSGSKSMMCETFSLPSEALNGNVPGLYTDPYTGARLNYTFIGATAVINNVNSINGFIAPGSPDIEQVPVTLNQTTDLQFVIEDFFAYVTLMDTVFGPTSGNALIDTHQECFYCTACCGGAGSYADQLQSGLIETYAGLLMQLRAGLELELTGAGLDSLRTAVSSSQTRIADFQTQFEDQIAQPMLNQQGTINSALTYSNVVAIVLIVSILIPTGFVVGNVIHGIFKSHRSSYSDPHIVPQNPFHASAGWCVSIWYAIIVFLVAGLLGLGGYAESATCEVTSNFDSFVDTAWSLYGNQTSSSTTTTDEFKTTLDQCFKSTGDGDILASVVINDSTGETAKDAISTVSAMSAQFDLIYNIPPGQSTKYTEEPVFVRMIAAMEEYKGLYMMSAATVTQLLADPSYSGTSALDLDAQKLGFGGSADCNGFTSIALAGSIGDWIRSTLNAAGYSIPESATTVDVGGSGLYGTTLAEASINIGASGSTCPSSYTGVSSGTNKPYSTLMAEKMSVLQNSAYRCDTIAVTRSSDNHAVVTTTPATCNWTQWLVYWENLRTTLIAKGEMIDTTQASTATIINDEVRQPVQNDIIASVNVLNTGLDCRFLNARWNNLYAAMCWEQAPGLVGLAYCILFLAVLAWIAMTLQFVIWRHLRDNKCLWQDAIEGNGPKIYSNPVIVVD